MDKLLLKIRKNDVLRLIQELKIPTSAFKWITLISEDDNRSEISALTVLEYEFYFVFDSSSQFLITRRKPGTKLPIEKHYSNDWKEQRALVESWLRMVRMELEAPDLWELASQQKPLLETIDAADEENQPLTAQQQEIIAKLLPEIGAYM